jgi:hypothetical protein
LSFSLSLDREREDEDEERRLALDLLDLRRDSSDGERDLTMRSFMQFDLMGLCYGTGHGPGLYVSREVSTLISRWHFSHFTDG